MGTKQPLPFEIRVTDLGVLGSWYRGFQGLFSPKETLVSATWASYFGQERTHKLTSCFLTHPPIMHKPRGSLRVQCRILPG